MKGIRLSKKLSVLLICLLMLTLTVSVCAVGTISWTDEKNTIGTYPIEHNHIYGDWVITQTPTCSSEGIRTKTCIFSAEVDGTVKTCNHTFNESVPADPEVHTKSGSETITKAPTCSAPGESEYYCNGCKTTIKVYLEPTEHQFNEDDWVVVKPVHGKYLYDKEGSRTNRCTVCKTMVTEVIPVGHVFDTAGTVDTAATCVSEGVMIQRCSICEEDRLVSIPVDPDNHVYSGKAMLVGSIDCQTPGTGIIRCDGCGEVAEVEIPADKEHKYLQWGEYVEPGTPCVGDEDGNAKNGYIKRVCMNHDEELVVESITWGGHVFDGNEKTHASTCTTPGYKKGTCTICGLTGVETYLPLDPEAHSWYQEVLVEPTCTEEGYAFRICKYDASHNEYVTLEPSGHTFVTEWTVTKEATCNKTGEKSNYCITCGQNIKETLPIEPDNHPADLKWTVYQKPECDAEGIERAYCYECSKYDYIERKIPKHTDTLTLKSRTDATCSMPGEIVYDCTKCGEDIIEILPADPSVHKISTEFREEKAATCSEEGLMSKVCIYCSKALEIKEGEHAQYTIPKLPHTVRAWKLVEGEEPTCTTDGKKSRTCLVCNHVETITASAEHRYKSWVVPEGQDISCTKAGVRTRGCYNCNETWTETFYADHQLGGWTPYNNASCEKGGTFRRNCVNCGYSKEQKTIKAGEHIELIPGAVRNAVSDSVCSEQDFECTYCNETVTISGSHTLMATSTAVEPTCETAGITSGYMCYKCRYQIAPKTLDALGHTFEYNSDGTRYCTRCNFYYSQSGSGEERACTHFCHNRGIVGKVLTKVLTFFWKLFGTNHFCECGAAHYHAEDVTVHSETFDEDVLTEIKYSCKECKVKDKKYTF